jgi:heme-degrading monooxygenase HmoA
MSPQGLNIDAQKINFICLGAAMSVIANTPKPPYFAVIFTSTRTAGDHGYDAVAHRMLELAAQQSGFLGVESATQEIGITVSYWADMDSIKHWKANAEHVQAQTVGRKFWYQDFKVRIAKVERDYSL